MTGAGIALAAAVLLASPAAAHDIHAAAQSVATVPEQPVPELPLPLHLGGPFDLIDQHGERRTEADPEGRLQLLFFGYASCQSICTVALPQMAAIAEGLKARGVALRPVMITVDPARDTPAAMATALAKFTPDFVGLTGSDTALQSAYRRFSIDHTLVFEDPFDGAVYAHGSLLYLLDGAGRFLTVIPPILTDERVMDIIADYATAG